MARALTISLALAGLLCADVVKADGAKTWLGTWRPVMIEGRALNADAGNPEITFGADGSIGGSLGCNRMGGRWAGGATGLTFSDLVATRMACLGPAMDTENRFSALLAKTWRVERVANGLTVWTPGGQSQFVKVK